MTPPGAEHCLQVVHYANDGWLLHKSSDEARKQQEQEKAEAEAAARFQAEMDRALKEKVGIKRHRQGLVHVDGLRMQRPQAYDSTAPADMLRIWAV